MAKTRALLTDTERERLAGIADVEDIKIYQARSRVRRRLEEELPFDLEILRENEPAIFEELCEAVISEMERGGMSPDDVASSSGRERDSDEEQRDGREQRDTAAAEQPEARAEQRRKEPETAAGGLPEPVNDEDVSKAVQRLEFGLVRKGTAEDRRENLLQAYAIVQERGEAKPRHVKEAFEEADFSGSEESWYENFIKEYLPQLPGAEYEGGQGAGTWVYTGESR